jgi:hypothetical protein
LFQSKVSNFRGPPPVSGAPGTTPTSALSPLHEVPYEDASYAMNSGNSTAPSELILAMSEGSLTTHMNPESKPSDATRESSNLEETGSSSPCERVRERGERLTEGGRGTDGGVGGGRPTDTRRSSQFHLSSSHRSESGLSVLDRPSLKSNQAEIPDPLERITIDSILSGGMPSGWSLLPVPSLFFSSLLSFALLFSFLLRLRK